MKRLYFPFLIVLLMCLSSCSVIGGIFKAGAAVGIITVIVVIALIIWIASMFRGK
ncbi:MAG: phosphatidate cytidylyltransferase [Mucilaginibacter sp.]